MNVQHAIKAQAQLMVQCVEWRWVFSKHEPYFIQCHRLQVTLEGHSYYCGAKLSELELESDFKEVEIRDHSCSDTIKKLPSWLRANMHLL